MSVVLILAMLTSYFKLHTCYDVKDRLICTTLYCPRNGWCDCGSSCSCACASPVFLTTSGRILHAPPKHPIDHHPGSVPLHNLKLSEVDDCLPVTPRSVFILIYAVSTLLVYGCTCNEQVALHPQCASVLWESTRDRTRPKRKQKPHLINEESTTLIGPSIRNTNQYKPLAI